MGNASIDTSQSGKVLISGGISDNLCLYPRIRNREYPDGKVNEVAYIGNVYGLDSHAGFGGDVFDRDGFARALMARDHKDPILVFEV